MGNTHQVLGGVPKMKVQVSHLAAPQRPSWDLDRTANHNSLLLKSQLFVYLVVYEVCILSFVFPPDVGGDHSTTDQLGLLAFLLLLLITTKSVLNFLQLPSTNKLFPIIMSLPNSTTLFHHVLKPLIYVLFHQFSLPICLLIASNVFLAITSIVINHLMVIVSQQVPIILLIPHNLHTMVLGVHTVQH